MEAEQEAPIVAAYGPNAVAYGDNILIAISGGKKSFLQRVQEGKHVKLYQKFVVPSSSLVGLIYGQWFEVQDKASTEDKDFKIIKRVADHSVSQYQTTVSVSSILPSTIVKDDLSSAISQQEIEALQAKGVSGSEIISKIQESSSSFDKKTEFSKFKWIQRARERHGLFFQIKKVTPYSLSRHLLTAKKTEQRVIIPPANLALLVNASGAAESSRILVVDDAYGSLAAAVCWAAQREKAEPAFEDTAVVVTGKTMGAAIRGALQEINMLTKEGPVRDNAPFVCPLGLHKFVDPDDAAMNEHFPGLQEVAEGQEQGRIKSARAKATEQSAKLGADAPVPAAPVPRPPRGKFHQEDLGNFLLREYRKWAERKGFAPNGPAIDAQEAARAAMPIDAEVSLHSLPAPPAAFDSLAIASRSRPLPLVIALSPYLAAGATVAVYTELEAHAAELSMALHRARACQIRIQQSSEKLWQMLPGRTHPVMLGHTPTGYVVSWVAMPPHEERELVRKSRPTKRRRR
eukprot:gnl/Dysnectes_brevis/1019_a1136_1899.p1 GENE.gnl/Dysnectes_brevis/1019_a1136_1899~~gnl/Dysnectes_brevis/1019_a1136_1899.p1  ORF type:complete len:516 (+),score=157.42 gnl/Dysnectes_brevis/1019_a1136_1899:87-1634(+)